jgi:hypothetical protein
LKTQLLEQKPPVEKFVSIPIQATTFWTPAHVSRAVFSKCTMDTNPDDTMRLALVDGVFAMLDAELLPKRMWRPEIWGAAGIFDHLDYRLPPEQLACQQIQYSTFKAKQETWANGMYCWIWCQLNVHDDEVNQGTEYPYSAAVKKRKYGDNNKNNGFMEFSSLTSDGACHASNWYNIFFPFDTKIRFNTDDEIQAVVESDLQRFQPWYKIRICMKRCNQQEEKILYDKEIHELFPTWWNDDDEI